MNRIERYSEWCSIDRLDGKDLVHGEKLILRWPDGKLQQTEIVVEKNGYEISDHGAPYTAIRSHAFIAITFRGISVNVPLVGLEAQRVEEEP